MEMQTPANDYRTPADAVNHRQELIPMPLRVPRKAYERLDAARARTGLSIQEHARRALDLYLAVIEREAIELGLMPERIPPAQNPPREAAETEGQGVAGTNLRDLPASTGGRRARARVAKTMKRRPSTSLPTTSPSWRPRPPTLPSAPISSTSPYTAGGNADPDPGDPHMPEPSEGVAHRRRPLKR
jgi:hypothetical protein